MLPRLGLEYECITIITKIIITKTDKQLDVGKWKTDTLILMPTEPSF